MIVPCIELVRAKKNHIIDRDFGRRVFLDPPFPGGTLACVAQKWAIA
jgi:hypothetical protein